MKIGKKIFLICLVCVFFLTAFAGCGEGNSEKSGNSEYKIAVVPKMTSVGWFQRMEEGVNSYNEENGTDYFFGGSTDGADQAAYLEQLLAEDWDAICVVPFDSESVAPILEKAKEEGILVITHEAASMDSQYFDYDIEAFESSDFGENFAQQLVEKTGGKGTYVQFVGSLNSVSQNEWCDAADTYFSQNSTMTKLGRFETNDDLTSAYNQTKELLQAHPEITAIEGSASTDIAGVAQAVEELGFSGKIAICGPSLSSVSGEYIKSGTILSFSLWDPAEAGKAMLVLAESILSAGEDFKPENCSLNISGYESMTYKNKVFFGDARCDITIDNLSDYDF